MLTELSLKILNKPGELKRILHILDSFGVQAFNASEAGVNSVIRVILSDPNGARPQLERHKIKFEVSEVIAIALKNQRGELTKIADILAHQGINVEHCFLTFEMTRRRPIFLLKISRDKTEKALNTLKDVGFELCDEIEEPLQALAAPVAQGIDIYPKGDPGKLRAIIRAGESGVVEFRTSMRWDIRAQKVNVEVGKDLLRSIAAFMNARGGVILVGINDDGTVRGLEDDLRTLKKPNQDNLLFAFSDMLSRWEMTEYFSLIESYFLTIEDKLIFVIEVGRSESPVWFQSGEEFYIRVGPTDRRLNSREALSYINNHWIRKWES